MLKIALAGNPNSGKTTLFNTLTGSTAHVGNWPGVTVDKKDGVYKRGDFEAEIIDLPGIYSLSPYTPEEVIARNYILDETPDCIINIVDATNLERNLYLTTQLMEVEVPIVVALNMTDVLEKNGDKIDVKMLEKRLGLPVAEISALRETGVEALMQKVMAAAQQKRKSVSVLHEIALGKAIQNAENALRLKGVNSPLFHAVKLVEKDELEVKAHPREAAAVEEFVAINCSDTQEKGEPFCDTEAVIADARYKYIEKHCSTTMTRSPRYEKDGMSKSDKVDKVLTNRWAAIPVFLVILFAVFHLTFSEDLLYLGAIIKPFGEWCAQEGGALKSVFFAGGINSPGAILFYLMDLITATIGEWLSLGLNALGASPWAQGLICDGIWGGIASVLSFVPQIMVLFLFFSILEDSGYMARVAFILDKIFRRFGVSGRAFMPMIMGFGCSIPAMMNTRTLANDKERTATLRVIPFFSCGAKTPILTAIAGAIIASSSKGGSEDLIVYSMYLLGIVVAVISLLLMRSTTMRGETPPFIMELPAYHLPRPKNLALHLWDKLKHYIEKAFTIILVSCVVIWLLSNFTWDWEFLIKEYYIIDGKPVLLSSLPQGTQILQENIVHMNAEMHRSVLGSIGKFVQFLFTPMGFGLQLGENGWIFAVAAITGLIAKENVIATFGTLAASLGLGLVGSEDGVMEVQAMISATGVTVPALISFIMFNMTTIPCFAAVASAKGEVQKGKFKWTILFWAVTSYIVGSVVYAVGTMIASGALWSVLTSIGILVTGVIVAIAVTLYNKRMNEKERSVRLLGAK